MSKETNITFSIRQSQLLVAEICDTAYLEILYMASIVKTFSVRQQQCVAACSLSLRSDWLKWVWCLLHPALLARIQDRREESLKHARIGTQNPWKQNNGTISILTVFLTWRNVQVNHVWRRGNDSCNQFVIASSKALQIPLQDWTPHPKVSPFDSLNTETSPTKRLLSCPPE